MTIQDATRKYELIRDVYQHGLNGVDALLRVAVSQDPKLLGQAKLLQAQYTRGFDIADLHGNVQPEPPRARHSMNAKTMKGSKKK